MSRDEGVRASVTAFRRGAEISPLIEALRAHIARIEESFRRHDIDGAHAPSVSVAGFWATPAEAEAAREAIRESVLGAETADAR